MSSCAVQARKSNGRCVWFAVDKYLCRFVSRLLVTHTLVFDNLSCLTSKSSWISVSSAHSSFMTLSFADFFSLLLPLLQLRTGYALPGGLSGACRLDRSVPSSREYATLGEEKTETMCSFPWSVPLTNSCFGLANSEFMLPICIEIAA